MVTRGLGMGGGDDLGGLGLPPPDRIFSITDGLLVPLEPEEVLLLDNDGELLLLDPESWSKSSSSL